MDKATPSHGRVVPGISIRNGPLKEIDTPMSDVNGIEVNGTGLPKRKAREGLARLSYAKPESSDDDDKPLVRPSVPSSSPTLSLEIKSQNADMRLEQTTQDFDAKGSGCIRVRLG